jgi:hypothetical protein
LLWGPSGALNITKSGISNFLVRFGEKKRDVRFLRMDTRVENHILYVIFSESDENSANYMIINEFQEFQLEVRQTGCEDFDTLIVHENSCSLFAWDNPTYPLEITITFRFKDPKVYYSDPIRVTFEEIDTYKYLQIRPKSPLFEDLQIGIVVYIEGPTRKLRFFDKREKKLSFDIKNPDNIPSLMRRPANFMKQSDDVLLFQFKLSLKSIGVSVIGDYKGKRMEIMYITLQGPEMMILERAGTRIFHIRVKYINIDNNSSLLNPFPVALTPKKYKELMNSGKFIFDVCLEENSMAKEVTLIFQAKIY